MAIVLTGAEAIVHGMLDLLKDKLNTKLGDLSDEYPDEDRLPEVADDMFFSGDVGAADGVPSIQVLVARTEGIDVYNPQFDAQHTILVLATVFHLDVQDLTQMVYRYARAITRAIAEDPTINGTVTQVAEVRHDFAPVLQVTGGYSKEVYVEVVTRRRETGV